MRKGKIIMAELKKLISLENLTSYDTLIKKYVDDADAVVDAKSIKKVVVNGDNIEFYKSTAEGATPDFTVAISSSDVKQLLEDVAELQGTVAGYSSTSTVAAGVAAAEKNAKDHADAEIKKLAEGAVATNTADIAAINNSETGILKQAKDYTDALANGQVKTNKEAIEAINDSTTGIKAVVKKYTDDEVKKVTDSIGTVTEGETVVSMIADAKKAGTDADAHLEAYKTTNDVAVKAAQDAADAAQGDVDALEDVVGDMSAVKTAAKTVAGAVDELYDAIDSASEAGEVSIVEAAGSGDVLKTYTFYQGEQKESNKIGVISLAKDLVVTSGEVVKNPEGQEPGTYIKLTIANQEAPIFINVLDLVNDFTVEQSAAQIQLAISETREISAEIVDGSVNTDALGAGAVTTAKIADGNVTKVKLSSDVQASLDAADNAAQAIVDAIDALDSTKSQTAGADGLALEIVEEDGVITSISGSIAANTYDAFGSAKAVQDDLDTYKYEVASTTDINKLFSNVTE